MKAIDDYSVVKDWYFECYLRVVNILKRVEAAGFSYDFKGECPQYIRIVELDRGFNYEELHMFLNGWETATKYTKERGQ